MYSFTINQTQLEFLQNQIEDRIRSEKGKASAFSKRDQYQATLARQRLATWQQIQSQLATTIRQAD